jgi:hypothetical protein
MKRVTIYVFAIVIVTIIITPLYTYLVAHNIVTDAVNALEVDSGSPQPIHIGTNDVTYADYFSFTNRADISLKLDYVNVTVFVTNFPSNDAQYAIGGFNIENETVVDANKQIGFPLSFVVTSEDALNQIYSSSYGIGEKIEITASGSYLFWHFTKQTITVTMP